MRAGVKQITAGLRRNLNVYRSLLSHPRCPWTAKVLLGLAVAYALSPIDIIPDFIPVLGHLDDAVILPVVLLLALRFIPKDLMEEVRAGTAAVRTSDHEPKS
jgi:uncharacterized membrane protein YkvA (DUF1232 family)